MAGNDQKTVDWSFMDGPEDNIERAVGVAHEEVRDFTDPLPTKGEVLTGKSHFSLAVGLKNLRSIQHLSRHVFFLHGVEVVPAFETVCKFVKKQGNSQAFLQNKSAVGYVFNQTNYAQYRLEMFTHEKKMGLKCDTLDGFAPAVTDFWNDLKKNLNEENLIPAEEVMFLNDEEDEEDSFWDEDSMDLDGNDSGLSIPGLDLNVAKFLQFTENPDIVQNYIEDLDDPNFNQHTLLVLAWNAQQKENLQVMCEKYAQPLFDAVVACMINSTLPMVRCSAMIVSLLACEKAMKISQDQFHTLINTLNTWTLSKKTNNSEVTQSDEIAQLITRNLQSFENLLSENPQDSALDVLKKIHDETEFIEVKQNLSDYLASTTLRVC